MARRNRCVRAETGVPTSGLTSAPASTISGAEAYRHYMDHTMPFLRANGGDVLFVGNGGPLLIGPDEERWDLAILVLQSSTASFLAFADNKDYHFGLGHRTAALEDSRLLPLTDWKVTSGHAGLPG